MAEEKPWSEYVNTQGEQDRTEEEWWSEVGRVYNRDQPLIRAIKALYEKGHLDIEDLNNIFYMGEWSLKTRY